jgi:hypothetical protein
VGKQTKNTTHKCAHTCRKVRGTERNVH